MGILLFLALDKCAVSLGLSLGTFNADIAVSCALGENKRINRGSGSAKNAHHHANSSTMHLRTYILI